MKRTVNFVLSMFVMACGVMFVASCTQKPEDALTDLLESAKEAKYDKLAKYVFPDSIEIDDEDETRFVEAWSDMEFDKLIKLTSYEITKAELDSTGTRYDFEVSTIFESTTYLEKGTLYFGSDDRWHLDFSNFEGVTKKPYTKELLARAFVKQREILALKGIPEYMRRFAYCLEGNEYIREDLEKSFMWAQKSAEMGDAKGMTFLAYLYEEGKGCEKDEEKGMEWRLKSAEMGNTDAYFGVGYNYQNGIGVDVDYEEAINWYEKGIAVNDESCANNMGYMYKNGLGVEQDNEKALSYYKKAADLGDEVAMLNIGVCYENGTGVERNLEEAMKWYEMSANKGYAVAMRYLGNNYYNGICVAQDYRKAFKWYKKAADLDDAWGVIGLGKCYQYGKGVKKDVRYASNLYIRAYRELGCSEGYEYFRHCVR